MKKIMLILCSFLLITSSFLTGCSTESKASGEYQFKKGMEGWKGEYVDLPADQNQWDIYELEIKHDKIPIEGKDLYGIRMQGHNRSDDLFMFIYKDFSRLEPNTDYDVDISFDIATNVPKGASGIGGSPGVSVFVKTGASTIMPEPVEDNLGNLRLNIDKNNQSKSGKDLEVVGDLEKPSNDQSDKFELKSYNLKKSVKTDEDGKAWVVIGTDSGYEGLTVYYITNVKVNFTRQ